MDKENRSTKRKNIVFCITTAAILVTGLCCYFILGQKDVSNSNSEELALFPALNVANYVDGTFQEGFEQALKDQFAMHDGAVAFTASSDSAFSRLYNAAGNTLHGKDAEEGLVPFGNVYRMNGTDWLTNMPYEQNNENISAYRKKAEEINAFAKKHPDAKVYVYYCTRAEDMDWFDGVEGTQSYNYRALLKSLLSGDIKFDSLKFRDFGNFSELMYKTDHHWNNTGAAQGYADLLMMLSHDFTVGQARCILYAEDFGGLRWTGSRIRESGVGISKEDMDVFAVNQYVLPEHRTWFGETEQSIGLAEQYASGQVERSIGFDQYLNYYGFESKAIRLEYEDSPTGANLLIIGDSFARALREPLASHFDTTVYVNFRILGETDLDAIMAQYDIDAVVFMGQQDAWSGYFLNDNGTGAS